MSAPNQNIQLAMQHHRAGRLTEAEALYRQVLQHDPRQPDALHLLGVLAYQNGRAAAAADLIRSAIAVNGSHPDFHNNLGLAYQALGQPDAAVACFHRALALRPDFAEAHNNLGNSLHELGRLEAAQACYQQALSLRGDYAEAFYNLGNVLNSQGRFDDAIDCFRKALAQNPNVAEVHYNLGNALNLAGRPAAAEPCYRTALALRPTYPEAWHSLAYACLRQGRTDEAVACCRQALALKPDYAAAHDTWLIAMLYTSAFSPADIGAAHRRYAEQFETPLKARWTVHRNRRDPERRLRIGYVSPDFRRHSVAAFIEPVLAHHDRTGVEVYCYYNHAMTDEVTGRIRGYADRWCDCSGWTDDRLSERIRADGIDILVDLAGHTGHNRLLTFARKPAPVQVTYLGYPATTGLTAMDYRLTSADLDPAGSEDHYSESLYRLPRLPWCFHPAADMREVFAPAPATAHGAITFGSMNQFPKISPATIQVWIRLLQALPQARLVMTNVPEGPARDGLADRFRAAGIAPGRVTLHGRLATGDYHSLLCTIDLALDPFPYAGTTTTCEALWMGIPVITLIGRTSVSRSGYALLKTVGLEELCATNETDYVRIAAELAGDLSRLNALRQGMRARLEASPLRDEEGLARDIEQAYRMMWRNWCARP